MTRRYLAYKDSGVEWLGEVPEGWSVKRLGMIATGIQTGPFGSQLHTEDYVDGGVPLINPSNIREGQIVVDEEVTVTPSTASRLDVHALQPGDIVMGPRGELGRCAVVPKSQSGFLCGTGSLKIRLDKDAAEPTFISAAIRTTGVREWLSLQSVGSTMENLNTSIVSNIPLAVPPLSEQTTIAAFLDRETAKIDALVAEQRRLIDLLREKRQAVISHAVTKGLNPTAPLKPSGIEWLGDVPEGWEVLPIKALAKLAGRIGYRGYTTADIVEEGEGAITLSPSNIREGVVSFEKSTYISWAKYQESPEIQLAAQDIVMVKTGSTFGKVGFLSNGSIPPATINPQLVIFKEVSCLPEYLFLSLNADHIRSRIDVSNTGGTIPTMTQEAIGNFRVALPSRQEQEIIVNSIREASAKLHTLTATAETAIALLQERRAALVSAAVTGKIDVRHLAPQATEAA